MNLTRKTIVDILKTNITETRDGVSVIFPEDFDKIAHDVMTELNRGIKIRKDCLSVGSRDGKHSPIISDEGVYCGSCGMDLY